MSLTDDKSQEILQAISLLKPHSVFVYLLGSYGTPRFHKESDIDFAFFSKKELDFENHIQLKTQLEDIFQREVDLVSLNKIDPIFARQVIETGRVLFCEEPSAIPQWIAEQNSKYIDFKLDRKKIEENLLKKKSYNGK